jgi:succinate dehydrogenase / fumarate reductase membrane anchor subunit
MAGYRTSLSRARGLGAAGHGVGHWLAERVTSIALIPLVIWAVYSALMLAAGTYETAVAWLGSPVNAVLLGLLVAVGFWHMQVGLRVVIEDYIGRPLTRSALLIANLFVCILGAALAIFSVAKVAITGGAY